MTTRNRARPRISITKLAEYMVATAGRRRTILVDQEFPSVFKPETGARGRHAPVDRPY